MGYACIIMGQAFAKISSCKQCMFSHYIDEEGMEFKKDYQRREQLEEEKLKSGENIQKGQ